MELIPAVAYPTLDLSSSIRSMKQETCRFIFSLEAHSLLDRHSLWKHFHELSPGMFGSRIPAVKVLEKYCLYYGSPLGLWPNTWNKGLAQPEITCLKNVGLDVSREYTLLVKIP